MRSHIKIISEPLTNILVYYEWPHAHQYTITPLSDNILSIVINERLRKRATGIIKTDKD